MSDAIDMRATILQGLIAIAPCTAQDLFSRFEGRYSLYQITQALARSIEKGAAMCVGRRGRQGVYQPVGASQSQTSTRKAEKAERPAPVIPRARVICFRGMHDFEDRRKDAIPYRSAPCLSGSHLPAGITTLEYI
ncbi:MAG: hypothetical protein JO142_02125 [Burkholderiales bacterium]|nr:hypothetical protein [Burkholderiales bacterium]